MCVSIHSTSDVNMLCIDRKWFVEAASMNLSMSVYNIALLRTVRDENHHRRQERESG